MWLFQKLYDISFYHQIFDYNCFVCRSDGNGNYAEVNLGSVCNILRETPIADDADMIGNMTVRFFRKPIWAIRMEISAISGRFECIVCTDTLYWILNGFCFVCLFVCFFFVSCHLSSLIKCSLFSFKI